MYVAVTALSAVVMAIHSWTSVIKVINGLSPTGRIMEAGACLSRSP